MTDSTNQVSAGPQDNCEINQDHQNESKQRLFIRSLLEQGRQPPSLAFGRDSKAGRGGGKLYSGQRNGFKYALTGGCWQAESAERLTRGVGILGDWFSLVGPKLEAGTKIRLAIKSWLFGANCYRVYCLASWIVG